MAQGKRSHAPRITVASFARQPVTEKRGACAVPFPLLQMPGLASRGRERDVAQRCTSDAARWRIQETGRAVRLGKGRLTLYLIAAQGISHVGRHLSDQECRL